MVTQTTIGGTRPPFLPSFIPPLVVGSINMKYQLQWWKACRLTHRFMQIMPWFLPLLAFWLKIKRLGIPLTFIFIEFNLITSKGGLQELKHVQTFFYLGCINIWSPFHWKTHVDCFDMIRSSAIFIQNFESW